MGRVALLSALVLFWAGNAAAMSIWEETFDDLTNISLSGLSTTLNGDGTITFHGTGSGAVTFIGSAVSTSITGLELEITVTSFDVGDQLLVNLGFLDAAMNPIGFEFGFLNLTAAGTYTRLLSEITVPAGAVYVRPLFDIGDPPPSAGDDFWVRVDHLQWVPEPSFLALLGSGLLAGRIARRPRRS